LRGEHRGKAEGESDAKNGGTPGQQRVNHDISISELGLQRIGSAANWAGDKSGRRTRNKRRSSGCARMAFLLRRRKDAG
jgi:hypothetical protein